MTRLRISADLALPLDFITQTAAVLAIRGAGKSNLAAVLAEQMYAAKLPFAVIDPTGTWVGLRAAGTGPGLGVVIFGGREADVPIERSSGPLVADLLAEERLSCVLDVSEFSEGDKLHFLTDFGRRLYQKNRDPLHLILEEADDYVPQKPGPRQAECLRVFQDIVRRGRARGLGITMVTQRSAVISKDVLTQIETLFVLRTTSPQDRKAIESWVDYHGQSRELVASLPSLKPGEAWVWSPHYLSTVKRIQVHRRTTLDTAATPKDARGRRAPATKADVDLEAVRTRMAATIERAKADDPKALRARIAELERDMRAAAARGMVADPEALEEARREGRAQVAAEVVMLRRRVDERDSRLRRLLEDVTGGVHAIDKAMRGLVAEVAPDALGPVDAGGSPGAAGPRGSVAALRLPRTSAAPATASAAPARQATGPGAALSARSGEARMLSILATYFPAGLPEGQWAALAGLKRSGGTWSTYKSRLRAAGYLEERGGLYHATEAGVAAAGEVPAQPSTVAEVLETWRTKPGMRPVMPLVETVLAQHPITKGALAEACGLTHGAGTFSTYLSRARTAGLIADEGGGLVPGAAFEGLS